MKLQKLLKKLALPVFALVVVGMLAACSSPSGGSGGDNKSSDTPPALNADTEYTIAFDSSLTDTDKAAFKKMNIEAGDEISGAEIDAIKQQFADAGYTYTVSGTTVTIKKKPASSDPSAGKSESKGEYTIKYDGLVIGSCSAEKLSEMPEGAGTVSGKEVTMTSKYVDSLLSKMGSSMKTTFVAVAFYDGSPVSGLTQSQFDYLDTLLIKDTDYKISTDEKIIVLTDSGWEKVKQTNPSSSTTNENKTSEESNTQSPSTPSSENTTQEEDQQSTTSEATYTLYKTNQKITIKTKNDGSYMAHNLINNVTFPEESGTYFIKGGKITLTATKRAGSGIGLEEIPAESRESITYVIGKDNVLEKDKGDSESTQQPSNTENPYYQVDDGDELDPSKIPDEYYKIYYEGTLINSMDPDALAIFAKYVGLEASDYTKDDTKKTITLTEEGYKKITSFGKEN